MKAKIGSEVLGADTTEQVNALLKQGRVEDALKVSGRLVAGNDASHSALVAHSNALKAAHRHDEALEFDRKAAARFPESGVAWHNLAATLGDLGFGEEALDALAKGFRLGLDSPLSYLVKARAHIACVDVAAAEAAFREVLRRVPTFTDVAIEYADLVWMAHGKMDDAQTVLDRAFHAGARPAPLLIAKAKLFESTGDLERAAAMLAHAAGQLPEESDLVLAAAQAALQAGQPDRAEQFAARALAQFPDSIAAQVQLTVIYLTTGRADLALSTIRGALERAPLDQSVLAWASTAARGAGDPLYRELLDFESMVGVYDIEAPSGWRDRESFLRDLGGALGRVHVMREHPAAQSLRHGTQTTYRLSGSKDPAIAAFFKAVDKPVREFLAKSGSGPDPLRRRNTGAYRIAGAWSVRLRPGGFHLDHMHQQGWMSSAFYVETPENSLKEASRAGWLRLGQPPFETLPDQPAERFVLPKPGRLVLFPSYMWHGTVPFFNDERRTTIAFDLLPA